VFNRIFVNEKDGTQFSKKVGVKLVKTNRIIRLRKINTVACISVAFGVFFFIFSYIFAYKKSFFQSTSKKKYFAGKRKNLYKYLEIKS
jgi:hypothetical protein